MSIPFDITHYRQGYTVGVGGIVLNNNRVLLTSVAYGSNKGDWSLPGGFVERNETINNAIQREILEETGIHAEVKGLIAVRNRIMTDENSIYLVFLLYSEDANPSPDGVEIQEARFFTFEEIQTLPKLRPLSKLLITQVFESKTQSLMGSSLPEYPISEFILFH